MSEHAKATTPQPSVSLLQQHHFLLRRLHSLTGIVPVGAFLCFHLFTNFQMVFGTFQHEVEFIHNMPALLFIEIFGLWLPIAFHAVLGLVYTFSGKLNSVHYPYMDNWRYSLQRVTGIIALLFIFLHIAKLRWGWTFGGLVDTPFYLQHIDETGKVWKLAHASTVLAIQHAFPLMLIVYIIGVYSAVYHWCNGLWTAAISWGLTISVQAQRRWGYACLGLGLVLSLFSAGALYSSLVTKVPDDQVKLIQNLKSGQIQYNPHGDAVGQTAPAIPSRH